MRLPVPRARCDDLRFRHQVVQAGLQSEGAFDGRAGATGCAGAERVIRLERRKGGTARGYVEYGITDHIEGSHARLTVAPDMLAVASLHLHVHPHALTSVAAG